MFGESPQVNEMACTVVEVSYSHFVLKPRVNVINIRTVATAVRTAPNRVCPYKMLRVNEWNTKSLSNNIRRKSANSFGLSMLHIRVIELSNWSFAGKAGGQKEQCVHISHQSAFDPNPYTCGYLERKKYLNDKQVNLFKSMNQDLCLKLVKHHLLS
jgi:hypothetical protein